MSAPASAPTSAAARILIVDDDRGLAHLLDRALKREGFATAVALSGQAALDWLAKNPADLVLVDLKLQDISGADLVKRLAETGRSVPFIVITGQGDERAAVDMMKCGALDYIVKDTKFVELIPTTVNRALGQIATEKRLQAALAEHRRLEREILEISDRELNRIGRDLHDGLGQQLTALELYCAGMVTELETHAPKLAPAGRELGRHLRDIVRGARALSHGLSPLPLEGNGLANALLELADSTRLLAKIRCDFVCTPSVNVKNPAVATHLYRIAQEAVNNALKHSKTGKINISVVRAGKGLKMTVEDYGRGFASETAVTTGMGLRVMQYRAGLIGAELDVMAKPGKGTCIVCRLSQTL